MERFEIEAESQKLIRASLDLEAGWDFLYRIFDLIESKFNEASRLIPGGIIFPVTGLLYKILPGFKL
ncbi:MAG: hypothetical protein PVG06_21585 [Desulfobacterales bacterium]|jgi:hypothetical protein